MLAENSICKRGKDPFNFIEFKILLETKILHLEDGRGNDPTKAGEVLPEAHDGVHHHYRLAEEYWRLDLEQKFKNQEMCLEISPFFQS